MGMFLRMQVCLAGGNHQGCLCGLTNFVPTLIGLADARMIAAQTGFQQVQQILVFLRGNLLSSYFKMTSRLITHTFHMDIT